MKRFKINIEGKELKVTAPESWQELKVIHYIRMESFEWNGADVVHLLKILTGEELSELDNITDKSLTEPLYKAFSFLYTKPIDMEKLNPSKHILLNGKKLRVPKEIEGHSIGQKIMLQNLMQGDLVTKIPEAMAIYFQPLYDNDKFKRERLPSIQKKIEQMPIIEAYPIVRFFLSKLKQHQLNGMI